MAKPNFRSAKMAALAAAAMAILACPAVGFTAPISEEDVPATSVVPAGGESAAAPVTSPSSAPSAGAMPMIPALAPKPAPHRTVKSSVPEIEPTAARLKVLEAAPVYSVPSKSSKHIEQLTPDKFVVVTGSTHYFLQVKLKSGKVGYIEPSAVELVKPADKIFRLSHDAGVLEKPNRWAKKLAEVHHGHDVHVVGVSLNYMQIRMKSGLEGFIPITALE